MLNCVVRVIDEHEMTLHSFRLKHGGPFSKAEAQKWVKEEFPNAESIVIYGPRHKMYTVYKAFGFRLD